MRTAIAVAVLLVAVVAFANPIAIEMYIDFDPPNFVPSVYPDPYTAVDAYVVADFSYVGQDVYAVCFDIDSAFGAIVFSGSFTPAVPTYTVQIVDDGITVLSDDCFSGFPVTLGYMPLLYTGAPDIVQIHPHGTNGHVFVLCNTMEEYEYCYTMDGGIGMEPGGSELCGNPVEDIGWGAIKAMYR